MQVRQFMKESPRCIGENATLKEAAKLMNEIGCGILPVIQGDAAGAYSKRPIGVVTDRDIVIRCVAEGADSESTLVRDAYTPDPLMCDEKCSVADAFEKMRTQNVGRLLVTDASGNLTGIITMADLIARDPREIWTQLPGAEQPQPRKVA